MGKPRGRPPKGSKKKKDTEEKKSPLIGIKFPQTIPKGKSRVAKWKHRIKETDPERWKELQKKHNEYSKASKERIKNDPERLAEFRRKAAERRRMYRKRDALQKQIDLALPKLIADKKEMEKQKLNNKDAATVDRQLEKVQQMFEAALPKNEARRNYIKRLFIESCLVEITDGLKKEKVKRQKAQKYVEKECLNVEPFAADIEEFKTELNFDEIEIKEEDNGDKFIYYDNINDVYCRACFKILTSENDRNKIDDEFLTAIRETLQMTMTFKNGSTWVCNDCHETVTEFSRFRKQLITKQGKFSIMVNKGEHEDLIEIQNLSKLDVEIQKPISVRSNVGHEVMIKDDPETENIFVSELPACPEIDLKEILGHKKVSPDVHVLPKLTYTKKKCKHCNLFFMDLVAHQIKKHGLEQIFSCSGCDFQSDTRAKVSAHIRYAHSNYPREDRNRGEERRACEFCGKLVWYLQDHIESIHKGIKKCFCDLCDFSCHKKLSMQHHVQNCHLPKNVKCSLCSFETINKERLQKHIKNMHENNERPRIQCPIETCKKILKTQNYYEIHMKRVHQKENKVKCDDPECKKMFYERCEMLRHFQRMHSPRNYICEICGSAFGVPFALKHHIKTQHREKTLTCDYCDEKFHVKSKLNLHIRRRHTFEKTYKCTEPDCDMMFYLKNHVKRHVLTFHRGIRFECQVPGCKSSLGRRDAYINHLKAHKELSKEEFDELFKKLNQFCEEIEYS